MYIDEMELLNCICKYVPKDQINNFINDLTWNDLDLSSEEKINLISHNNTIIPFILNTCTIDDFINIANSNVYITEDIKNSIIKCIDNYKDINTDTTIIEKILNSKLVNWKDDFKNGFVQNLNDCIYEDSILPLETVKVLFRIYAKENNWFKCIYNNTEYCEDFDKLIEYISITIPEKITTKILMDIFNVDEDTLINYFREYEGYSEEEIQLELKNKESTFNNEDLAKLFIEEGRWKML